MGIVPILPPNSGHVFDVFWCLWCLFGIHCCQVLHIPRCALLRFNTRGSCAAHQNRALREEGPRILPSRNRDPPIPRPPSLRQWLLRGGVHTSACCVFCCLLCCILFCLSCLDLFFESQLFQQVARSVAVLLCCVLRSRVFSALVDLLLICLLVCLVSLYSWLVRWFSLLLGGSQVSTCSTGFEFTGFFPLKVNRGYSSVYFAE